MFTFFPCTSATSTGNLQGLDSTNGGVCRTKSMKLVLRVGQSKYFVLACVWHYVCKTGCVNEKDTTVGQTMWKIKIIVWFWLLCCNKIISSLDLLSGQIILIIHSFCWREITAMNDLKTLIQTSGSLRPLAVAVYNLFIYLFFWIKIRIAGGLFFHHFVFLSFTLKYNKADLNTFISNT